MESRHEFDADRTALLAEELTDAELQELLLRLGQAEFGGSERATIGAVVEATGHDAIEIGRILGEIRREAYDQRFGLKLGSHEQRIEHLEDVTARIEKRQPEQVDVSPHPDYVDAFGGKWSSWTRERAEKMLAPVGEAREANWKKLDRKQQAKNTIRVICALVVIAVSMILFEAVSSRYEAAVDDRVPQPHTTTNVGRSVPARAFKPKGGNVSSDLPAGP